MYYDVIVCGGGVQGLWTAYYLAERKKKVLLLEQFPLPHTRGSSHGPSRIARYSYAESHFTRMMPECFRKWEQLESQKKIQLFVNCGLMTFLSKERAMNMKKILLKHGISFDHVQYTGTDIAECYPGITADGFDGIYEKTGGVLKADQCLQALRDSIVSLGGVIHDSEKVFKILPIGENEARITTNKQTYKSRSVVLTCGTWINKVLKQLDLQLPVKPLRVQVTYWKAKDPDLYKKEGFPAIIFDDPSVADVYSLPILEYPGLMKVCLHAGVEVDPDQRDHYDVTLAAQQMNILTDNVKKHYPNLVPVPALQETCMYTVSSDHNLILDCHPRYKNIVIGTGFSGTGFKLSPVVGRILGQLALDEAPPDPMEKFTLKRFHQASHL